MPRRFFKQLGYGIFYLLLWGGVVWVGYVLFVKQAPSCFDHKQNEGEQGVDCGGPCAKVCTTGAQAMSVVAVNSFASSDGHDTVLAQIANPNLDFGAQWFDYAFNFYDNSDTLVQTIPGQSFIYPQEVKYILLPNQEVPDSVARSDFAITSVGWVASSTMGIEPQFTLQNLTTQVGSSTATASGEILNSNTASFSNILVVAIFKDANGNPIGVSQTTIDAIGPDQTQSFSVIYPAVSTINPANTQIEIYSVGE